MKLRTDRMIVPRARTDDLVVRELSDEVLVYDLRRDQAHCLNRSAALVWQNCNGRRTVKAVARRLSRAFQMPVDAQVVWLALNQLGKFHLLEERATKPLASSVISRRELIRTLGVAAAVALPVVTSIVAPRAVEAATIIPPGACSQRSPDPAGSCGNMPCPPVPGTPSTACRTVFNALGQPVGCNCM